MRKSAKEIIFAVPGSKVYISKYYNNRPNSFLNISLTGKKCELMCSHCKARLLLDMADINSSEFVNATDDFVLPDALKPEYNRVMEIILRYQNNCAEPATGASKGDKTKGRGEDNGRPAYGYGTAIDGKTKTCTTEADTAGGSISADVGITDGEYSGGSLTIDKAKVGEVKDTRTSVNGVLISGGFDRCGRLVLDERILPELKDVKNKYGRAMKVFMHLGFTDRQTAESIYKCGIDGVLVNIFSDKQSIEETYNLKGCTPDMFYENVRILKGAGLRVSPHIIIGLGDSSLSGEYRSVKEIAESGADSCVFAVAKNLSGKDKPALPQVKPSDVVKLFKYAKSIMPGTPVSFGCARPHGKEFEKMEIELVKLGISVIAFPSERTIDYAKDNNYTFCFEEQCCAFLSDM